MQKLFFYIKSLVIPERKQPETVNKMARAEKPLTSPILLNFSDIHLKIDENEIKYPAIKMFDVLEKDCEQKRIIALKKINSQNSLLSKEIILTKKTWKEMKKFMSKVDEWFHSENTDEPAKVSAYTLKETRRSKILLQFQIFGEKKYINFRLFRRYPTESYPTAKGVCFHFDHWKRIVHLVEFIDKVFSDKSIQLTNNSEESINDYTMYKSLLNNVFDKIKQKVDTDSEDEYDLYTCSQALD